MNMTIEQALSRGSLTMLVRVIGPMVVGFLVGALILGWTFKIVSPLGEEGVVIAIFGTFVALICSGFICGCLLCWLLPEQNRLQPILIFFCSPAPLDAIALILFMIYKWAREEYHSPDSQPFQDFPMLMGFVLVICGVSSLAGWGIFKN